MKTKNMTKRISSLLLAFVMVLSIALAAPVTADAATTARPANGKTTNAPFSKGTGGSNSFRIPALTTLSDGTLVAAADARWNTTYDGGGLDTIVSRSTDNGATWNYTFANYLGDNGNTYSGSGSTAFIDPALAVTADDTIYMLVDLYPYGVALNGSGNTAPVTKKGFDSNGRLLLSSNNHSSYNYYLENGKIYSSSGSVVSGYTVDDHFNITGNGYDTNLFFSDSPYKVVRTGFLYLTKSTDKGATWSAPQLLDLKTSSERVCLVGPGRGLVTADGTIVFPVYSYNGSQETQKMGFIYSTDGVNWKRSANFNYSWASESAVVELADGTLRFFFRNGTTNLCYVDYNMGTNAWGSSVNTGLDTNSNCQISAISYSKTSDGKQVLLVSCPTGPNEAGSDQSGASYRLNGKIFVGVVNDNNTMSWKQSIPVTSNNSPFMYSCLAELSDGSVAILYENLENAWGAGTNCYYTMAYKTYQADALGVSFDAPGTGNITLTDNATGITVTAPGLTGLTVGQMAAPSVENAVEGRVKAWTITASTDDGIYTGSAGVSVPVPAGWTNVEALGMEGTVKNGYITLDVSSLSNVVIYDRDTSVLVELQRGESLTKIDTTGNYASSYTGADLDRSVAQVTVKGVDGISETTVNSTKATALENGATYIIRVYNTSYALSANAGRGDWGTTTRAFEYNALTADTAHMWTLEASGNGYKLKNSDGYLNLGTGNNSAYLNNTGEVFTITYTSSGWTIGNGKVYVNALGGLTWYYSAGGWTQDSTRFDLYKVTEKTDSTTEITFTGISSGTTYTTIGNTPYKIVVEGGACVHNYAADTQEPTCETAGSTTYTCTLCGDSYTDEIAALGHDYKTVTVEATCEKAGSVTTTCAACGDKAVETIAALGHDYKTETVKATCTTDGGTIYTCAACDHSYIADKVAAYGHAYTTATVAATCETAGSVTKTCTNCGDRSVETIPALGHDYETVTVAATCTTTGSASKVCTTCGDKAVETIPALGHDYKTVTVAATCETAGSVTKTCAACGDKTVETTPALGHNYKTTTVAATCETAGSVTTACAACGDKTVETIPALGHSYSSTTVAPTCTADGYTTHKCSTCGDSYTSDQTAALGHNYTSQQVDNDMVYTCTHCGHSYSETLVKNYTYDKVTSFASGESYVITLYSNRKYYAVTHTNNAISVKQVTVSGNKITTEITDDMLWDYSGSKLSYESNGKTYYLYTQTSSGWWNSSTTLTLSTTDATTVSFSGSKLKIGSNYLRYSSNKVSLNRSATTAYLFKQNEQ